MKFSHWISRKFETIIEVKPIYEDLDSEKKLRVLGEVKKWIKIEEEKL